jgi:hypothetical protein
MTMLRIALFSLLFVIISACTPQTATPAPTVTVPDAPQPAAVPNDGLFITPDFDVTWQWRDLTPDERYVVRLWYGDNDEDFREIWAETNTISVQEPIDSYGRDMGDFHWQVAALQTNEDGGFGAMVSDWSDIQTLQRVRRMPIDPVPESERSEMAAHLAAQNFDSTGELLHYYRQFVHEHTNIGQDNALTAFERFRADYADAAQMMID